MAATLTTEEIYRGFMGRPEEGRTFYHGHTYTGNPLAAAVALANLDLIESSRLLASLPAKIARLQQHLERMAALPCVGGHTAKGNDCRREVGGRQAVKTALCGRTANGPGRLYACPGSWGLLRPLGDVIVLFPPLSIDLALLDRLCDAAYASMEEVCCQRS